MVRCYQLLNKHGSYIARLNLLRLQSPSHSCKTHLGPEYDPYMDPFRQQRVSNNSFFRDP